MSYKEKKLFKVARELNVSTDRVVEFLEEEGFSDALSGNGFNASILDEEAYLVLRQEYADDADAAERVRELRQEASDNEDAYVELRRQQEQQIVGKVDLGALSDRSKKNSKESDSDEHKKTDDRAERNIQDRLASGEDPSVSPTPTSGDIRLFKPSPIVQTTFSEALSPARFAKSFQDSTLHNLSSHLGDLWGLAFESLEYARESGRIYFSLSHKGKKLVEGGEAYFEVHKETGKLLPTIKSTGSGKFVEQVKGVRGKSLTSTLSKMGNVIISSAHIISGMDVVNRLDDVRKDTQFLVKARQIDQFAKLKAVYNTCREAIDLPDSQVKEKLERSYEKLFELRYQVCGDVEYRLNEVENPNDKGWFSRFISTKRGRDQEVVEGTVNALELGQYTEVSFLLQLALADRLGRLDRFTSRILPDELKQMKEMADMVKERASYISGSHQDQGLELDSAVQYFRGISERYRAFATPPQRIKNGAGI